MTRILVLYNKPADTAAFDRYYFATHVPIAKRMPGLRAYTVSAEAPGVIAGGAPPYLVAELDFDNGADVAAILASPEGRATAGDLANFAQAGATILSYETRSV
jgi:uncharacterized protein (TIGR02118 family)